MAPVIQFKSPFLQRSNNAAPVFPLMNSGSPQAQGLLFWGTPGQGNYVRDPIGKLIVPSLAYPGFVQTPYGLAIPATRFGQGARISAPANLQSLTSLTMMVVFQQLATPIANGRYFGISFASADTTPFGQYFLGVDGTPTNVWLAFNVAGTFNNSLTGGGLPSNNMLHTLIGVLSNGAQALYLDGVAVSNTSVAVASVSQGTDAKLSIGQSTADDDASLHVGSNILDCRIYNRLLTQLEATEYHRNWTDLHATQPPYSRTYFFPSVAAAVIPPVVAPVQSHGPKPPDYVKINIDHPLAKNYLFGALLSSDGGEAEGVLGSLRNYWTFKGHTWGAEPTGGKLIFDGVNGQASAGYISKLDGIQRLTIIVRIRALALPAATKKFILGTQNIAAGPGFVLRTAPIGVAQSINDIEFYADFTNGMYTSTGDVLVLNQWSTIAVVYDGLAQDDASQLKIFTKRNDANLRQEALTITAAGDIPTSLPSAPGFPFTMAQSEDLDPTSSLNCEIDFLHVWNDVLTVDAIRQMMENPWQIMEKSANRKFFYTPTQATPPVPPGTEVNYTRAPKPSRSSQLNIDHPLAAGYLFGCMFSNVFGAVENALGFRSSWGFQGHTWGAEPTGGKVTFDGVYGAANIGYIPQLDGIVKATFIVRFRLLPGSLPGGADKFILGTQGNGTSGFILRNSRLDQGNPGFRDIAFACDSSLAVGYTTSRDVLVDGQWTTVAVVYNGLEQDDTSRLKMYTKIGDSGTFRQESLTVAGTIPSSLSSAFGLPFTIATPPDQLSGAASSFNIDVDFLHVWTVALTADSVRSMMENPWQIIDKFSYRKYSIGRKIIVLRRSTYNTRTNPLGQQVGFPRWQN